MYGLLGQLALITSSIVPWNETKLSGRVLSTASTLRKFAANSPPSFRTRTSLIGLSKISFLRTIFLALFRFSLHFTCLGSIYPLHSTSSLDLHLPMVSSLIGSATPTHFWYFQFPHRLYVAWMLVFTCPISAESLVVLHMMYVYEASWLHVEIVVVLLVHLLAFGLLAVRLVVPYTRELL